MKNNMAETVVRRRRVLVVEDHDDTRKLILATLRLRNFDTESAADSDTGLEKFNSFKPDLVLLDIMMPGRLDGLDMCRQIRADAGDAVKIAFVTAKGQSTDFANGRSAKADAYIVKPFGPIKFLETVDWLLV